MEKHLGSLRGVQDNLYFVSKCFLFKLMLLVALISSCHKVLWSVELWGEKQTNKQNPTDFWHLDEKTSS